MESSMAAVELNGQDTRNQEYGSGLMLRDFDRLRAPIHAAQRKQVARMQQSNVYSDVSD